MITRYATMILAMGALSLSVTAHAQTTTRYSPDFSCDPPPPKNGVATMLCSDSEAAKHELMFDQVYYALRQQVGEKGWPELKRRIILEENQVDQKCGLPVPGADNQAIPPQGAACYETEMDKLAATEKENLVSAAAKEEASRPIDQHIALQQKLIDLGWLDGTKADGVYGEETRRAVRGWKESTHLDLVTAYLSDEDSEALRNSQIKRPLDSLTCITNGGDYDTASVDIDSESRVPACVVEASKRDFYPIMSDMNMTKTNFPEQRDLLINLVSQCYRKVENPKSLRSAQCVLEDTALRWFNRDIVNARLALGVARYETPLFISEDSIEERVKMYYMPLFSDADLLKSYYDVASLYVIAPGRHPGTYSKFLKDVKSMRKSGQM